MKLFREIRENSMYMNEAWTGCWKERRKEGKKGEGRTDRKEMREGEREEAEGGRWGEGERPDDVQETLKLKLLLLLSRFSHVRLCVTPQTAAHQAPPSLGFSRQEHWSGLPFPSPMHESEVAQSCPTLSDPMDCSLPGSSVHGIFQARVLEWGAIAFS